MDLPPVDRGSGVEYVHRRRVRFHLASDRRTDRCAAIHLREHEWIQRERLAGPDADPFELGEVAPERRGVPGLLSMADRQGSVEPSLKAAWEHEYLYSALPITAGFAGIPGPTATFFGPSEGHDSAVVSAGVSVQWTPAVSTYVNYDGQLGRGNYSSNAVTGGVRISF